MVPASETHSSPDPDLGESTPWRIQNLFRDHNDTLLRFLRARLNSDADAREAAQEAYCRLLQLDRADQPSFLRAYLFKVAANVATDIIRQRITRKSADPAEDERWTPASQERALSAKQQLVAVQKALEELPPRCREAFLLSRHDGFGTVEIAARLNVSDRMVRSYLTRALEHLRSALEIEDPGR